MAINIHVLHAITTASATIAQITSAEPSPTTEKILGLAAGYPHPLFRGVASQRPVVNFSTPQLATLLGITGLTGGDLSGGNVDLEWKAAVNFGTRVANATTGHTRMRMAESMLYWSQIRAQHKGEAEANCQIMALFDGTNEPIVPTGSVALAAESTAAEHFTAGPVSLNGSALDDVQEITITSGLRFFSVGSGGEIWDRYVAVEQTDPIVTVRTHALGVWTSVGLDGLAISSFTAYLRKKAAHGTNVANGTAEHISFTATSGIVHVENSRGGNNTPAETILSFELTSPDDDTAPLVIDTTAAIS